MVEPLCDQIMQKIKQAAELYHMLLLVVAPASQRQPGSSPTLTLDQIDRMDAYNFEMLVGMIYQARGYTIEETPKSGDQGADVVLEKGGERTVVQAKLYDGKVGNAAVQQAVAAKGPWRCHHAMVVTNSEFTESAVELAQTNGVELVDRPKLTGMVDDFNRVPKDVEKMWGLLRPRGDNDTADTKESVS